MNINKSSHSVLFAIALAIPCLSSASPITVSFGGTAVTNEGVVSSVAGSNTVNFDNGVLPSTYSLTGNGGIAQGNTSGITAEPTNDTSNYLTTGIGTATITPLAPVSYFGLDWSTIDSYNTIVFGFANGTSTSYNGAQIAALDGIQSNGTTSAFVNFFSSTPITSIALSSTDYAFESDNHAFLAASATPEPSTWMLTAAGLGLATLFFRRRQQQVRG